MVYRIGAEALCGLLSADLRVVRPERRGQGGRLRERPFCGRKMVVRVSECPVCDRKVLWAGMSWAEHTEEYHQALRRVLLRVIGRQLAREAGARARGAQIAAQGLDRRGRSG
jgi:hypothetical protein